MDNTSVVTPKRHIDIHYVNNMELKNSISDYTEVVCSTSKEIEKENVVATDDVLDVLLEHFVKITGASRWNGSDLLS